MASIILPTTEWTSACDDLLGQVKPEDEFIIVCDHETDPVVEKARDEDVRIEAAGEPEGCSGKANAVAAGLEASEDEIIICTDGDFDRDDDWRDQMVDNVEEHGAASTIPFFQIKSFVGNLLDAPVLLFGLSIFLTGTPIWGGALGFKRSDVDIEAMNADLRQTVADDLLMGHYIDDVYFDTSLTTAVPVDGSADSYLNRGIRFMRGIWYYSPMDIIAVLVSNAIFVAITILNPIAAFIGTTAVSGLAYWYLGYRRWTFLLAFPGFFASILMTLYGLAHTTFTWHGRRYKWASKFDVEVLDDQ